MSFLALQNQARKPFAEVLPDGRKRLTRYFKVNQASSNIPVELDYPVATPDPWTNSTDGAPAGWTGLLLTYKQMRESERGFPDGTEDSKPICQIVFEQIAATGETTTGGDDQTDLPDGRTQLVLTFVQFSSQPFVPQTINVSTATADNGTVCYLFSEETENDGTLINIKRTYQSPGTVATDDESLQGGALLLKKITSFHTVPATPSGYTPVGTPVQNPNGYPIYTYTFAKGAGQISQDDKTLSGGSLLIREISYLDVPGSSNPISTPSGYTLYDAQYKDQDGYRLWNASFAKGNGALPTVITGREDGSLVYVESALGATAATPSYSGTGTAYLVKIDQTAQDGYYLNVATYIKPQGYSFVRTVNFTVPGLATADNPSTFDPPITRRLKATVTVAFATSVNANTPYTITTWAQLSEVYTLTDGTTQSTIRALDGYVGASSDIGTNTTYRGLSVLSYNVNVYGSTPSAKPSGSTILDVDSEIYLTQTNGTIVYKNTTVTFTF